MKSYLSKLADRATLGNVPSSIPMRAKPHDLVAEPRSDASQVELTSPTRRPPESQLQQPESISQLSPTPIGVMKHEVKSVVSQLDNTQPQEITATRIEHSLDPVKALERDERQVEKRSSPTTANVDDKQIDLEAMASLSLDLEQLASVQQDQIGLLKRADEFMADLLTSRSQLNESRDADQSIPQSTNAERLQPQTDKSSQKHSPPTRVAEPEPPSLVIGKLTVEVSSPASPQPRSPITVVHVRDQARRGVPSSRRFGIGQF